MQKAKVNQLSDRMRLTGGNDSNGFALFDARMSLTKSSQPREGSHSCLVKPGIGVGLIR